VREGKRGEGKDTGPELVRQLGYATFHRPRSKREKRGGEGEKREKGRGCPVASIIDPPASEPVRGRKKGKGEITSSLIGQNASMGRLHHIRPLEKKKKGKKEPSRASATSRPCRVWPS